VAKPTKKFESLNDSGDEGYFAFEVLWSLFFFQLNKPTSKQKK
jgi:hypothetical protein